jgi:hypothetical protein
VLRDGRAAVRSEGPRIERAIDAASVVSLESTDAVGHGRERFNQSTPTMTRYACREEAMPRLESEKKMRELAAQFRTT